MTSHLDVATLLEIENIPLRRERVIVIEAALRFSQLVASRHFPHLRGPGTPGVGRTQILRALWLGHLCATPLRLPEVVQWTGLPKSTLMRELHYLRDRGHIVNRRGRYFIASEWMAQARHTDFLEKAIALICKTADALRKESRRSPKGVLRGTR
jgi:hypothetical protein